MAAVNAWSLRTMLPYVAAFFDGATDSRLGTGLVRFGLRFPSLLRGAMMHGLACLQPPAAFAHRGGAALMLIPGFLSTPSALNRLGRELERLGCDVYLPRPVFSSPVPLPNTGPLEQAVDALFEDLELLAAEQAVDEIVLVGHSLGGIIALDALAKASASGRSLPRLRFAVLLATPLRGTPLAAPLRGLFAACRTLSPGEDNLGPLQPALAKVQCILSAGGDSLVPLASQEAIPARCVRFDDFQHTDFYVGRGDRVARAARVIAAVIGAATAPQA
jgi:pimeloyl-ACP methyl ester carboxylesterase